MRIALILIALCAALAVLLVTAMGWANDRAAQSKVAEGQAQALVIQARADYTERVAQANSQARLNAAAANAVLMTAAFPWGVLSLLACFGLGVVVLGLALVVHRPGQAPVRIIERQVVYLPAPGQRRGEVWQVLGEGAVVEVLGASVEKQTKVQR